MFFSRSPTRKRMSQWDGFGDSKREMHVTESAHPAEMTASVVPDDLQALRAVVEGTAAGIGQEFFRCLVRQLAAAKILGLNPSTLRSRLKKLGIERSAG